MNPKTLMMLMKGAQKLAEHEREHQTLARNRDKIDRGLATAEQGIGVVRGMLAKTNKPGT
jgi:hypothetical protein